MLKIETEWMVDSFHTNLNGGKEQKVSFESSF